MFFDHFAAQVRLIRVSRYAAIFIGSGLLA